MPCALTLTALPSSAASTPGHYIERAIRIHFKVHIGNRAFLTIQALLPEPVNAAVLATAPYNFPHEDTHGRSEVSTSPWGA